MARSNAGFDETRPGELEEVSEQVASREGACWSVEPRPDTTRPLRKEGMRMNDRSRPIRSLTLACLVLAAAVGSTVPRPASAASAAELTRDSSAELRKLYARQASARVLGQKARGILVFPAILKAGFMFGGQVGEGALWKNGRVVGYYNSVAASYGFQAGIQKFGYALFFMTDGALDQLNSTHGFEL